MSVDKKILRKLSDSELERYILPDSKYVLQAKIFAFEILQERNIVLTVDERARFNKLLSEDLAVKRNKTPFNLGIIWSPFIIVIGIIEVFLLFFSIYYLLVENNGGRALGGVFGLIGFFIFFFILVLEQFILKNLKTEKKTIWTIEIILLILTFSYLYIFGFSIG